jgi:hypothetical protein
MNFIDFLTPEHAQIAIGASFEEWDTMPYEDYNNTSSNQRRVLAHNVTHAEDSQVRDLYASPLTQYW